MRVGFEDDDLCRLFRDQSFHMSKLGPDLVKSFRKKVTLLLSARDELELRQWKSLHLEKLNGDRKGQSSIRLNDQWRLILRFDTDDEGKIVVVVELVDYH